MSYTPSPSLRPASAAAQTIQPLGDTNLALVLKGHSATYSSHFLEIQDYQGNVLLYVGNNGILNGFIASAVITDPGAVFQSITFHNTIQPTVDSEPGLLVKGHSPTAAAALLSLKKSDNTALFDLLPTGELQLGGSSGTAGSLLMSNGAGAAASWESATTLLAGAVILAPNSANRNMIQPTADNIYGLKILQHSATQSFPLFDCQDSSGSSDVFQVGPFGDVVISPNGTENQILEITDSNSGSDIFNAFRSGTPNHRSVEIQSQADTDVTLVLRSNGNTQSANIFEAREGLNRNAVFGIHNSDASGTNLSTIFQGASSSDTQTAITLATFVGSLPTATVAGFTSRWVGSMIDHAGSRECLRMEADGAAPRLSFYGATPAVVQQANASAAGVSGIVAGAAYSQADMTAVKAALTAIRAGLAQLGALANTT
jgi:hypothetical protein